MEIMVKWRVRERERIEGYCPQNTANIKYMKILGASKKTHRKWKDTIDLALKSI